jgi:hypothetical protein
MTKVGRPQKYPWQTWLNGDEHEIILDKDIECGLTTFRANLWKHSNKMNVRTITRCEERKVGRKTVTVLILKSFPKRDPNEKGKKSKRKLVGSC